MTIITCAFCGKDANRRTGEVNRANRAGLPLYCDRKCSSLAHKTGKTIEHRRAEKAAYDSVRRAALADRILSEKRAYYRKHRAVLLERMAARRANPKHREAMRRYQHAYVRNPHNRAAKKAYDRRLRAVKEFGETDMAEAVIAVHELCEMLRPSKPEIRTNTGRVNLCQKRKRRAHAKE